jgi:hypothetical protein
MALKEKKRPQRKVLTEESFDVTSVDQYIWTDECRAGI